LSRDSRDDQFLKVVTLKMKKKFFTFETLTCCHAVSASGADFMKTFQPKFTGKT
jgi:hypothetical protein